MHILAPSDKRLPMHGLEQYGHRENLEIDGIPFTKKKKTNEIVKKMANKLKVKLEDQDISISHRIFNDSKLSSRFGQFETRNNSKHPPIIVHFTDRDKKNEISKICSILMQLGPI